MTHDNWSFMSVVIVCSHFLHWLLKFSKRKKGTKVESTLESRPLIMMCCNCRSLGPANYQIELKVGSLGLLYFGNNQWLDCHCFDSVRSDQIIFTVNGATVVGRYKVGNYVTIISFMSCSWSLSPRAILFRVIILGFFYIFSGTFTVETFCVHI